MQVEFDSLICVSQISNGDILSNVQIEISPTGSHDKGALNGGSPYDLIVDQPLHMLQHRIALITGLSQFRIGIGAEEYRVRPIDAYESQAAESLGYCVRILAHIARQRHLRIAGALPHSHDSSGGIALEDGPILGKRDLARGVLRRLPV